MKEYPRVLAAAKVFNIGQDTLVEILEKYKIDISSLRSTTKLSKEMYDTINYEINGIVDEALVIEKKERVLHLGLNSFATFKREVRYKQLPILKTFFEDEQAVDLCNKMCSSFARKLYSDFKTNKGDKNLNLYQIHHIANNALDIFGGPMLTFIFSLRQLKFKNSKAIEVKNYQNVLPDFPLITFKIKNENFKIAFFAKRNIITQKPIADIRLFSSSREQIGSINLQGYVLTKLEKFKPKLLLFYEETKNNSFEIYSGVETGKCELCPRTLTHPTSLRIGIGPICAKNHNIDRSLYLYNNY